MPIPSGASGSVLDNQLANAANGIQEGESNSCAWFMVPPGFFNQVGSDILHLFEGQAFNVDIAQAQYACGAQAQAFRSKGLQSYSSQSAAQNAASSANASANPGETGSFIHTDLTQILLRVGEVLLGIVLVAVGVAKLTGADNAISKVVKTGAFL